MSNQGQICTATSRILVQDGIYDDSLAKFKTAVATITKIGDQWDETTYQGPQVSKAQYGRIMSYVEIGSEEGATTLMGGEACPINGRGYYISPTVFTNVKDSMRIYREEVFGPFVVISSFKEEEEAVARTNDFTYGLGASVFTENLSKGLRMAAEIEAGMVWINSSQDCNFRVPFAYSQVKAVHVNLGSRL